MSFIETHKRWILPLLGLGAVGVVYLNVTTFQGTSAPAGSPAAQATPAAEPDPAAPASSAPSQPVTGESLWDDLQSVATVPPDLSAQGTFEQQALAALPPVAFEPTPAGRVARPLRTEPAWTPPAPPRSPTATATPAPSPDFLIQGPGGTKAWFSGQGYRPGDTLQASPFMVRSIHIQPTPTVTLQGPSGAATRSTRPAPTPEVP